MHPQRKSWLHLCRLVLKSVTLNDLEGVITSDVCYIIPAPPRESEGACELLELLVNSCLRSEQCHILFSVQHNSSRSRSSGNAPYVQDHNSRMFAPVNYPFVRI